MMQHDIHLEHAGDSQLKIMIFSDREMRWIFSHNYIGEKLPGQAPDFVNKTRLVAEYRDGLLTDPIVLSMEIVVPSRLGQRFFAGVDISPGAKTYLEFRYERYLAGGTSRLAEICKGAREYIRVADLDPAFLKQFEFPFPVCDILEPERVSAQQSNVLRVPFRANDDTIANFTFPLSTTRIT